MSTAEEHLAAKPQPDGHVLLKTVDGEFHRRDFAADGSFEVQPYGVVFKHEQSRRVFPWSSIVFYDVFFNSADYEKKMLAWLKDCDHDWLTHPQVGHYCKHCRLDMKDLEPLLTDKFDETPALVVTDPSVDREAAKHEGVHDEAAHSKWSLTGRVEQPALNVRIMKLDEDPMSFCDCTPEAHAKHDGACRLRPETWPVEEIDPDDPSGGF